MAADGGETLAAAFAPEMIGGPGAAPGAVAEAPAGRARRVAPSRENRKAVVVHMDRGGYRELRILGIDSDRSLQSLLIEAIDDLLAKNGLRRIADGPAPE